MYGIRLTVYQVGSWLESRFPLLRNTHAGGHSWNDLIGWTGDPHLSPFHPASYGVPKCAVSGWLRWAGDIYTTPLKPTEEAPGDRMLRCGIRNTTISCW